MSKVKKNNLVALQTYIPKTMKKKIRTKWRKAGYMSESDYLRDLVRLDLK